MACNKSTKRDNKINDIAIGVSVFECRCLLIILGAGVGGVLAKFFTDGSFKPLPVILLKLDQHKKNILYTKCCEIVASFGPMDIGTLSSFVQGDINIRQRLLSVAGDYVQNVVIDYVKNELFKRK